MRQRKFGVFDPLIGGVRPAVSEAPLLSSADAGWGDLLVEHYSVASFELSDGFVLNHCIAVHLGDTVSLECKRQGRFQRTVLHPGDVSIVPSQLPHSTRSRGPLQFLSLSLEATSVALAASDLVDSNRVELPLRYGVQDPLIREIAGALKLELEAGQPSGRLYGETLANTLAMHVLRKHAVNPVRFRSHRGGLPRHLLRRVLDFIHEKALEPISLQDLATTVGLSQFYFTRLFKQSIGEPPYQYVLRCRVQRGAQMLLVPGTTIARVAVQTGFSDQSHFASHFKRFYGVSPAVYLRSQRK